MTEETWLSFPEAEQIVCGRLNASVGRARAMVGLAIKSGEVRRKLGPVLLEADDGIIGQHLRVGDDTDRNDFLERADFLDWLDRNKPLNAEHDKHRARDDLQKRRAAEAAQALWGAAGPAAHLQNDLICKEVMEWIKKNGQKGEISNTTILRAVGRKK
ncbi:MAG TPA: hypothetical protein VGH13_23080 [Xanthobacteraceae bacterium]|jgi:hypothetical protein